MNLLGMGARSISSENGDRAAICKALLMASIAALWCRRSSGDSDPWLSYHAIGNGPVYDASPGSVDVTLESVIGLGIVA